MNNKRAYVWSLAGRVLPQIIYLGTTMLLARFLSPEDFGVLGVLSIFLMVASTLIEAGFAGSLVNEKYIDQKDCSTVFTFCFVMSLFLYGVMFLCAPLIENFYHVDGLSNIVRMVCLIFVINSFQIVPSSILVKQLKFDRLTTIRIITVSLSSLLSLLVAYIYRNVYALVAYQLFQAIINALLVNLKPVFKMSLNFNVDCFKKLFSFGFYTTLSNVIDTIYENLLAVILGKALSIQQAGYLTQAKRLEEVSTQTITQTINSTSFPILSQKKGCLTDFVKEANAIFKFSVQLITPLMFVIVLYSKQIITLLFGKDWVPSSSYLSLLSIAGIIIIIETLNRTFIKSLGNVSSLFIVSLVKRCLGVLILLGCMFYDVESLMYGYIISSLLAYLINQWLYCKSIKASYFKSLISSLRYFMPSLIFLLLNILVFYYTSVISFRILATVLLLLLYYYLINRLAIDNFIVYKVRKNKYFVE